MSACGHRSGWWRAGCVALLALAGCAHRAAMRPSTGSTRSSAAQPAPTKSDHRYAQDQDSGPTAPPPDLSKIPEPVPRTEARSVYGNKSPYDVLGQTYTVLPSPQGYVERGIASWYGNKFHGYTTSNFEKYDMYAYTAAHKTLPLPSYARVTNLENGASVIVRVNDRGPFAENRIIDLSYVAALKLGIWQKGTGMVEVQAIDPSHPELPRTLRADTAREPARAPTPAATMPASASNERKTAVAVAPEYGHKAALYLQVGAYSDHANAERAAAALRNARLGEVRIVDSTVNGRSIQRVRLGPLKDVETVDSLTPQVRALGLGEPRAAVED
ncbi:MAG: septal ring lytic transglycosylase RlpA family protein [Gammaproteobacteria bacterium]|nr:MAG: septal ring lytic transglycosylase RlpA family protein [Gammaproteobacteria bacterium]